MEDCGIILLYLLELIKMNDSSIANN